MRIRDLNRARRAQMRLQICIQRFFYNIMEKEAVEKPWNRKGNSYVVIEKKER